MSNDRIQQDNLCETCVSRLICPVAGRACAGYNSENVFKGLLKQWAYTINWDAVLLSVKEQRKSSRGYRPNE